MINVFARWTRAGGGTRRIKRGRRPPRPARSGWRTRAPRPSHALQGRQEAALGADQQHTYSPSSGTRAPAGHSGCLIVSSTHIHAYKRCRTFSPTPNLCTHFPGQPPSGRVQLKAVTASSWAALTLGPWPATCGAGGFAAARSCSECFGHCSLRELQDPRTKFLKFVEDTPYHVA